MISTYPYFKDIDNVEDEDQSDIIGNCGEEKNYERKVDGFVKQMNLSDVSYYNAWAFQNLFVFYQALGEIGRASCRERV